MSQALIRTSGLSKQYGEVRALQSLDWSLPPGSITAILGPNGAGKTTLAKLILGITRPTSGSVEVLGRRLPEGLKEIRRAVGFVPEEKTLFPDMKGKAFLPFYGRFFPGFRRDVAKELLEGWSVPLNIRIKDLSKGNRAKLLLAVVLARKPKLLLLDEPTSDLDPASVEEVISVLAGWVADGERGVVITTHRLEEVERIGDRVLCLLEGRSVADDELDELRSRWRRIRGTGSPPPLKELQKLGGVRGVQAGDTWVTLVMEDNSQEGMERLRGAGMGQVSAEGMNLRDIYLALVNYNRGRLDGVLESLD